MWFLLIFLTSFLFSSSTSAIYFHIKEGTSKCFIEEVPEDTPIAGNWIGFIYSVFWYLGTYSIAVLQDDQFVRSPKHGVHVEIKDPEGNVVLSRVSRH